MGTDTEIEEEMNATGASRSVVAMRRAQFIFADQCEKNGVPYTDEVKAAFNNAITEMVAEIDYLDLAEILLDFELGYEGGEEGT